MGAYKKTVDRKVYIDFTDLYSPDDWAMHGILAARKKHRELRRLDPFAKCIGRKRAYENVEDLKKGIEAYFKSCEGLICNKQGIPIRDCKGKPVVGAVRPYTIAGLARSLGISTLTLRRYQHVAALGTIPPEFADVILEARQRIEEFAECMVYDRDGGRGAEFVLRAAFSWQTAKEAAETKAAKKRAKLLEQDIKLKKQVLQQFNAGESDITINVVRASKEEDD